MWKTTLQLSPSSSITCPAWAAAARRITALWRPAQHDNTSRRLKVYTVSRSTTLPAASWRSALKRCTWLLGSRAQNTQLFLYLSVHCRTAAVHVARTERT